MPPTGCWQGFHALRVGYLNKILDEILHGQLQRPFFLNFFRLLEVFRRKAMDPAL